MTGMRDLSHVIRAGMPVYPGDPAVEFATTARIETEGVEVTSLTLSTHSGTHLDAPSHSVRGGRTVAQISLEELRGPALLVRMPGLAPRAEITVAGIERALGAPLPAVLPAIVVIETGWAQHYGTDAAFRHPGLTPDAARALLARGMRVLCVDTFSPDLTEDGGTHFPVHDLVLGADGAIVENLCNLEGLPRHLEVEIVPLPIDADGAPARIIARDAG
ncbi:cyclase family protein [Agromyces soli]|uniref:Cyclase family protein n=2 Tax=Agromyces soli TaxID=659012 RepID=A0ABY4AXX7_9MICO|nr:cyclase family protein [Agromyces soli]UOE25710.1 cyclase family protein [Agromyces soli]